MPWRETNDPYRILISEIMLQQTQVARVMRFYPNFIKQFPDFHSLARARTAAVLRAWQGLGYNRRALALQKLSRIVLEKFNGQLPRGRETLESLPGIGKGTSGALRAFVWNEPEVFIETNIRRVFIHFFFPGRRKVTDEDIKRYIKSTLDEKNSREWYWALMDYGSSIPNMRRLDTTTDHGRKNPNKKSAHYKKQPKFFGSNRELRGKVLRLLLEKKAKALSLEFFSKRIGEPIKKVQMIGEALAKEGFVQKNGNTIKIIK